VLYWFGCRIIWAAARTHNKVAAKRGLLHQLSHGLAAGVDAGPCYLVAVAAAASPWPRPSSDGEEFVRSLDRVNIDAFATPQDAFVARLTG